MTLMVMTTMTMVQKRQKGGRERDGGALMLQILSLSLSLTRQVHMRDAKILCAAA